MDRAFVVALPKAELHLHLEGTLEPELAFALAARNGLTLPYADVAALRRAHDFVDLQSFLDLYYGCMAVLRTADDFHDLAAAYLARSRADGVVRAEVFFDPQEHTSRGIALAEVLDGLSRAADESAAAGGPQVALIACAVRHRGPEAAREMVESLEPHRGVVAGVGLDSTEAGHPPRLYAAAFEAADELGLHKVPHAGEGRPARAGGGPPAPPVRRGVRGGGRAGPPQGRARGRGGAAVVHLGGDRRAGRPSGRPRRPVRRGPGTGAAARGRRHPADHVPAV